MFLAGGVMAAQQPTKVPKAPSRDTAVRRDSTAADSTSDDEEEPARTITTGVSFGGLSYDGGRSERATSAIVRWRALPWLSIGVTPTVAHSTQPSVTAARQTTTASGLTDIPVEIGADHTFDVPLSPSLSFGVGITLPVGDTASGFGAGSVGSSITLGGGLSLTDKLGVHASAGRSLTDFTIQSSFNGTSSEYGDAGLSFQASDRFSMSAGVDGDIGSVDPAYGRAASVSGGVSISLPYVSSLSLNASRGISGATPTWSFAIGVGTDFASVGHVSLQSAATILHRSFGGGTHGLSAKSAKQTSTARRKHG